jgi:hypothetical protein
MKIYNSTDIPSQVLDLLISIARDGLGDEVLINKLYVRNKKKDIIRGNWGYYHIAERNISVRLPNQKHFPCKRIEPHLKEKYYLDNQIEFLLHVLSHEFRHAWQFQHKYDAFIHQEYMCEWDAEFYSFKKIMWWKSVDSKKVAVNH